MQKFVLIGLLVSAVAQANSKTDMKSDIFISGSSAATLYRSMNQVSEEKLQSTSSYVRQSRNIQCFKSIHGGASSNYLCKISMTVLGDFSDLHPVDSRSQLQEIAHRLRHDGGSGSQGHQPSRDEVAQPPSNQDEIEDQPNGCQ